MKTCDRCGADDNAEQARFCRKCGISFNKEDRPPESEEEKERREEKLREELWPLYLHKGKVLESWTAMVDGGKGQFDPFIDNVVKRVRAVNIPNLQEGIRGLFFDWQLKNSMMFYVLWRNVSPLHVCKMFINAQDYGENMSIRWYLLWDGEPWNEYDTDTAGKILYDFIFNLGNEQDLKAWVKIVHSIILDEVKQTMSGLNLDFSKVDVHTRGFLNLP